MAWTIAATVLTINPPSKVERIFLSEVRTMFYEEVHQNAVAVFLRSFDGAGLDEDSLQTLVWIVDTSKYLWFERVKDPH